MVLAKKILIIDDEAELADTCARLLRGLGFTCVVAYDIAHAMTLFDSERPSLVLSDISLPMSDGFEMARYVRQRSPETPVVLMTGYHTPQTARDAQDAGAAGYLRKPFSNSELISSINSLLGDHGRG